MAQGFLVSCIPSKGKRTKGRKTRFLAGKSAARNFAKTHISPGDNKAKITVTEFNSNGYLERVIKDEQAVAEFVNA